MSIFDSFLGSISPKFEPYHHPSFSDWIQVQQLEVLMVPGCLEWDGRWPCHLLRLGFLSLDELVTSCQPQALLVGSPKAGDFGVTQRFNFSEPSLLYA